MESIETRVNPSMKDAFADFGLRSFDVMKQAPPALSKLRASLTRD
jgi:hypothetical protein